MDLVHRAESYGARAGVLLCLSIIIAGTASPQTPTTKPTSAPAINHAPLSEVLRKHVRSDGTVDYATLKKDAAALDRYIDSLAGVKSDELPQDDRVALWLNAYNACTLRLVLDHYPVKAVTDIPAEKRWTDARWRIAGQTVSLDQIENEKLATAYGEPRVHFALFRGCRGAPPLRNEAYDPERLSVQLAEQAERAHRDERFARFDATQNAIFLTRIYDLHAGDFKRQSDTVLPYVAQYVPELAKALRSGAAVTIRWIECDWTLNDVPKPDTKEAGK